MATGVSASRRALTIGCLFAIFFAFGLFGVLAATLVPGVQIVFGLGLAMAFAVQWMPLVGCGLFALPMGRILHTIGAVRLMQAGLGLSLIGCLLLAGLVGWGPKGAGGYGAMLAGLLLLSGGATALQVTLNPLMLALDHGAPDARGSGVSLLVSGQALNSFGVLSGVHLSGYLVLGSAGDPALDGARVANGIAQAYATCAGIIAVVLLVALVVFQRTPQPTLPDRADRPQLLRPVLRCGWAMRGAFAIALYVGAEGAIGAMLISFLHQPRVLDLPLASAAAYLAEGYWGGAALSRLLGAFALRRIAPATMLGLVAGLAMLACLLAVCGTHELAGYSALATGCCNGIMFPVIFALTLERTTAPAGAVSSVLVLATTGGALVSMAVGLLAERHGFATAFLIPLGAYAYIALFALAARRQGERQDEREGERQGEPSPPAAGLPDGQGGGQAPGLHGDAIH